MKNLNFFSKKGTGLGLDLGSEWLKMVKIRQSKGGVLLENISRCPWLSSDLEDNAATAKKITDLWSQYQLKDQVAVSSLAGHSVIVKRVSFESESEKNLDEVIAKDSRQYIPFDINDVFLDYQLLGRGQKEKTYDVLLVASKKKVVQNLSDIIHQAGLSLSVIDVDSFALCNSFEHNYPDETEKPVYLLDIGGTQSVFCIYHNAQPVFLREVSFGGKAVTEALSSILNVTKIEAEHIKINGKKDSHTASDAAISDAVKKVARSWSDEVKRLIGFYQTSTANALPADKMLLSGGGALLPSLCECFQKNLNIDVALHDPFRKVKYDESLFQREYLRDIAPQMTVPFGLALRAV